MSGLVLRGVWTCISVSGLVHLVSGHVFLVSGIVVLDVWTCMFGAWTCTLVPGLVC